MKKTLLTILLLPFFANASNNLNANSSWEEIQSSPMIVLKNDKVKLSQSTASIFDVEYEAGRIYTKEATSDGYYEYTYGAGSHSVPSKYIETGKTIKSGDFDAPLTRTISVFKYEGFGGSNAGVREVFLFNKEYTIQEKM